MTSSIKSNSNNYFHDKLDYPFKVEDNFSAGCDDNMSETKSLIMRNSSLSLNSNPSSSPPTTCSVNSEKLINSQHLPQFFAAKSEQNITSDNTHNLLERQRQLNVTSSPPKSSFTIDNILGTIKSGLSESPCSSPTNDNYFKTNNEQFSPPIRVPAAMLHHSGLHLSQIAVSAASGFNTPSDFFGKCIKIKNINFLNRRQEFPFFIHICEIQFSLNFFIILIFYVFSKFPSGN